MEQQTINIINQCAEGAHSGTMHFPDIVKTLLEAGVGLYHVDFLRAETTYYLTNGQSHVVALPLPQESIGQEFCAQEVASAVHASQNDGQQYPQFVARAMRAGCIGYMAYLNGQRVVYGGRSGDMHTEHFPGSPLRHAS